jgi:tRNA C32,U32 (ribose-2'-O)-methylase TrmJ
MTRKYFSILGPLFVLLWSTGFIGAKYGLPFAGALSFVSVRCALVLGNEGVGQSFKRADFPGVGALRIPQWGRAQSLNVSVAAALGMYEYCSRWGKDQGVQRLHDRIREKHH